jgi:hypothetical protein
MVGGIMDIQEKREKMILIMACAIIGIGFAYLYLVTFFTLPETGRDHAKTIVGFILGVGISTLLNYYWGSSKGSADKSETIDKELGNGNPPVTNQTATFRSTETIDKTTELSKPVKVEEAKETEIKT